ncbi:hypothetical protein N657DRAFT_534348, partial [Parathielavia appendiculata]
MSFAPQFQPTGGFTFDPSSRSGQPLHANVFRPPASPSASSYNLAKSTGSLFSDISMSTAQSAGAAKRKRTRMEDSTPLDWNANMDEIEARGEGRSREFRRALGPKSDPEPDSQSWRGPATRSAPMLTGWNLFSLQTIGDMVGKVWEFCKKGAFRGFHAGGGQGYNVNGAIVTETTGTSSPPGPDASRPLADDTPMDPELPAYFPPVS